jgi:hypothetical protein
MIKLIYLLAEVWAIVVSIYAMRDKKVKLSINTVFFVFLEILYMLLVSYGIIIKETLIIVYVVFVAYVLLEFNEKLLDAICKTILSILMVMIVQMISYFPGVLVFQIFKNENIMVMFINGITLFIIYTLRRWGLFPKSLSLCKNKKLEYLFVIIVSFVIVLYYMIRIKKNELISLDVYIVSIIFIIIVIYMIIRWQRANYEIELREEQISSIRTCDQSLQRLIQQTRKNQHDFHNHLIAILGMNASIHTYEDLIKKQNEYCKHIENENKYNKILFGVKDPVLAGFLYNKVLVGAEKGIEVLFKVIVYSTKIDCISIFDLNEIIGILLDNAYEETTFRSDDNKKVYFDVEENPNELMIGVGNLCEYKTREQIIEMFQSDNTTKGSNRGLGLAKIKDYQENYGFDIMVENKQINNQNWIYFKIVILKETAII